jgi:abortive infection bacteriophage resistance protein
VSLVFNKPVLSLAAQLALLKRRGLTVQDDAKATHALQHIGYYRLSGYALPFQKGGTGADRHDFDPGADFDHILDRYVFDRKLRLVVMDAIERIEIAVRAALSNTLAEVHGPHWYMQPGMFEPGFRHAEFIDDIKRQIGYAPNHAKRRDIYIAHYFKTYRVPDMPPSWMVFESVSFGTVSLTCQGLRPHSCGAISRGYGLPRPVLISWLHSINYIRNICAHHARLWNRECRVKPMIAHAYAAELTPNDRLYAQLVVMQVMLKQVSPDTHWASRLRQLLGEHPLVPLRSMGFPTGWEAKAVWN